MNLRIMAAIAVLAAIATGSQPVLGLSAPRPAAAQLPVGPDVPIGGHLPPVGGPVLDPFRDPGEPWLPGNRGIEYDTQPGEEVRASADGVVVFAGSVAGSRHVTIRHSPTLRTTLAFVADVRVAVGDVVRQGDVVAIAGESIHFTARVGSTYIDPELLFGGVRHRVRLVPID